MPNIKISELSPVSPLSTSDQLPVVDVSAGATKKITIGEIIGIINGDVDVDNNGVATISELPVSKLQDGGARQLLQTDAAGTGVEWTDSIALPGTSTAASFIPSGSTVPTNGIYLSAANNVSIATNSTQRLLIGATGQIEAVSLGSAAAPTFVFTGDPNTGIYSPGADQLAISTGGVDRLRIDDSGRLLVGASAGNSLITADQVVSRAALSTTAPARIYTGSSTITDNTTAASGTVTHGTIVAFDNPAIAASNLTVTYTNASTVYVDGAPTAGTNVTVTNPYALYVNAGASFFGGNVNLSTGNEYRINNTKVVGARITGWAAPTGTATRTTFATSTVTTTQLAERVKALIDDLISHGLIGT